MDILWSPNFAQQERRTSLKGWSKSGLTVITYCKWSSVSRGLAVALQGQSITRS